MELKGPAPFHASFFPLTPVSLAYEKSSFSGREWAWLGARRSPGSVNITIGAWYEISHTTPPLSWMVSTSLSSTKVVFDFR